MPAPTGSLRPALTWPELLPPLRMGLWVLALFAAAVLLARELAVPIQAVLLAHPRLAVLIFFATSVTAVLLPALTNLPLVPIAVLAWGPAWTALLLLAGWVAGAALSFTLGRHARPFILRRFPSVCRHANIDRLIHPRHRMASLILLRMTFPVDVLSYALGLFSRRTTLRENMASTAAGGAPFAVLFALVPTLPAAAQVAVFVASTVAFAAYMAWVWRGPQPTPGQAPPG